MTERAALLERYNRAKTSLPEDHPATIPLSASMQLSDATGTPIPLWEREWKGGEAADDEGKEDSICGNGGSMSMVDDDEEGDDFEDVGSS